MKDEPEELQSERSSTSVGFVIVATLLAVFVLVFLVYPNFACCCRKHEVTR